MARDSTGLAGTSRPDSRPIDARLKPETKIDARTRTGRRLNALVRSLTAQLATDGEPLDDAVAAWVKLAAANMVRAEQISDAIGRGESIDDSDLVRLTNSANRTMKELRAMVAQRGKGGPSALDQYLAERAEPDEDEAES